MDVSFFDAAAAAAKTFDNQPIWQKIGGGGELKLSRFFILHVHMSSPLGIGVRSSNVLSQIEDVLHDLKD